MSSPNLYLQYKKDTSRLVQWIIRTSNGIVMSATTPSSMEVNTSGHLSIPQIVSMSKMIANHLQPTPHIILYLFRSVIAARSKLYESFRKLVTAESDPDLVRSNASHKFFIDALSQAFYALGGESWKPSGFSFHEEEPVDDSTFQNQFSALSLEQDVEADDDSSDDDEKEAKKKKSRTAKKGKKGKKGKRGKPSKKNSSAARNGEPVLADSPVGAYGIIEEHGGNLTDYSLAVHAVVQEWIELRHATQDLWSIVAQEGLNSAFAAALTNCAVAMVKQTCIAVFAEFPDHENFEAIMRTVTHGRSGDPSLIYNSKEPTGNEEKDAALGNVLIDGKENFWLYTFENLMEFLDDFRKNRTGKPTKAFQAELNTWNPDLDLSRATSEERVKWRRLYTINWLYDLVNVFVAPVVQRNNEGENHVMEDVDWSPKGPWHGSMRVFGLQEFAGVITSLAMQKPGTRVRDKILPHHVFQLQCLVDSFTTSRGWTFAPFCHHVMLPVSKFHPAHDLDLFLNCGTRVRGEGALEALEILLFLINRDLVDDKDPNRYLIDRIVIEELQVAFKNWLGKSRLGTEDYLPASRFSKHDSNGLYNYSPLLCGVGLVEGLVLTHRLGMRMLDQIPEVTLIIHLHNMLVKRGYLEEEIPVYSTLEKLYGYSFFSNGIAPDDNFLDALKSNTYSRKLHSVFFNSRTKSTLRSLHDPLHIKYNPSSKKKSVLSMYFDAEWVPDQIPDSEVHIRSELYDLRLSTIEQYTDPKTGQRKLKETELTKRALKEGETESTLLDAANYFDLANDPSQEKEKTRDPYRLWMERDKEHLQGRSLLSIIRHDICNDVCGHNPHSAFNYPWMVGQILAFFAEMEESFRDAQDPKFIDVYENPNYKGTAQKRTGFALRALTREDDRTLKHLADLFFRWRFSGNFIYWNSYLVKSSREETPSDTDA
ncbi:unnamed protein product [Periconia digitata]|uniref:DUF6604 domain-containing protein n=1 Tax=Periconia digitata TaxID=1303443 RepID=A0A9W4U9V4_9PLEO|nr:unnamed protein product [Periconia digitata]